MNKTITVLAGDGIGPEICAEAIKVLNAIAKKYCHCFDYIFKDFGGAAIDHYGTPFPFDARQAVLNSDAVLLGTVGGPSWSKCEKSPESGLLALQGTVGAYAYLRHVKIHDPLIPSSPLKEEICRGTDILIVRELAGGIYFGKHGNAPDGSSAFDTEEYSGGEIQRIAELAFGQALTRNKRLCSVDKSDRLDSSRLWRRCVGAVSRAYPDVELTHMHAEQAAARLISDPNQFDVLLCPNMLGDILSEQASSLTGLSISPCACIGGRVGIFTPAMTSQVEIAGHNLADPIGAILCSALMLRDFGLFDEALCIEQAVSSTLSEGIFTRDISQSGVTCSEMGDAIKNNI